MGKKKCNYSEEIFFRGGEGPYGNTPFKEGGNPWAPPITSIFFKRGRSFSSTGREGGGEVHQRPCNS